MTKKGRKKNKNLTVCLVITVTITVFAIILKLMGIELYFVSSPSMEDALHVGDLIVVAPKDFEDIKENDIITYLINDDLQTATHRVVQVNDTAQTFNTKGDNNETVDAMPVKYGNVRGEVVFSLPYLGYVVNFFGTIQGRITMGAVVIIFIILILLWKDEEAEQDSASDETAD